MRDLGDKKESKRVFLRPYGNCTIADLTNLQTKLYTLYPFSVNCDPIAYITLEGLFKIKSKEYIKMLDTINYKRSEHESAFRSLVNQVQGTYYDLGIDLE